MVTALHILSVLPRSFCSNFLPKANLSGDFAVSAFIEKETNYEFRDGKEVY